MSIDQPEETTEFRSPSQGIILDTNIIVYLANEPTQWQFSDHLSNLRSEGFELAISRFTRFEILKKSEPKKKTDQLIKLLNIFKSVDVTDVVLLIAGMLNTFYKSENVQRQADDGDLIIAATALLNESFVLTANRIDYPISFFEEIKVNPILYQEMPGLTRALAIYLLKPKRDFILRKLDEKLKPNS